MALIRPIPEAAGKKLALISGQNPAYYYAEIDDNEFTYAYAGLTMNLTRPDIKVVASYSAPNQTYTISNLNGKIYEKDTNSNNWILKYTVTDSESKTITWNTNDRFDMIGIVFD